MDLYIYYRVPCESAEELRRQVGRMQQDLSKRHGIASALKRRPTAKDGLHTWMEIYNSVPDGFDAILSQAVAATDLPSLIDGERHTEYFMDVSTCV